MASNYSWGQIRLLLQRFAGPGISLDTIDHTIRARYELILSAMDWQGIEQAGILQTVNGYNAGSITLTPGSTAVMSVGTNWTSAMSGWQLFMGTGPVYDVTITSPTSLILDRAYEGTSNGAYWIVKAIYELPDNCRELRQIFSPWDGAPLTAVDQDVFGELQGDFLPVGSLDPYGFQATNYVIWTDGTDSQDGETVQRILLYPVPVKSQGYPIKYDAVEETFDGTSTTDGPLAFVSAAALLAGCKADLEAEKDKPSQVKIEIFEAAFDKWLLGMIHVENGKHPNQRMRLDESYTIHRVERWLRSGGMDIVRNWMLQTSGDALASGSGTPQTDTFPGTGTQALFMLSQVPVSPPVTLVNNTLAGSGTYVQSGRVLNFLTGNIPANGAVVTVIYTY